MNTRPLRVGDQLELTAQSLAFGGESVSRHNNFIVFVEGLLPGEKGKVEITEVKTSFARGNLIAVLENSPHRREPPCSVFYVCGGCQWQHLEYEQQAEAKKHLLEMNFLRHLRKEIPVTFHKASHEFYYRNRIQVHLDRNGYSYKKRQSNEKVYFQKCWIANEKINQFLQEKSSELFTEHLSEQEIRLEVAVQENGEVIFAPTSYGSSHLGFGQVNREMNEILQKSIVDLVLPLAPQKVLELYSGAGNFTFPLLDLLPKTKYVAIESHQGLVLSANEKLRQDKYKDHQASFLSQSAEQWPRFDKKIDLLLVDPPRAGLSEKVKKLIEQHQPTHWIYVSCDPATLTRDLKDLQSFYDIQSVQAFDMFPQTSHVETLVYLKLK